MYSLTEENYLKALFMLPNEAGEVNVNELSRHLQIKMPTVTSMMKKLSSKGLVHYESYKPIRLTEQGQRVAALILRKHRLTEMYLVEKMGFGWEQVHVIAEQIEHIQSPEFFEKMDQLLGYPKMDPHGSPIPDKNGKVFWKEFKKLSEYQIGDKIRLSAVLNSSDDFLKFLNSRDLSLGTEVCITGYEPFDKSMVISYENYPALTLSHFICEKLLVEAI